MSLCISLAPAGFCGILYLNVFSGSRLRKLSASHFQKKLMSRISRTEVTFITQVCGMHRD